MAVPPAMADKIRLTGPAATIFMSYISPIKESFVATLERWFRDQPEILVLIRYSHAAGSKSFEFFSSFATLSERLRPLPPRTSVMAFRYP